MFVTNTDHFAYWYARIKIVCMAIS